MTFERNYVVMRVVISASASTDEHVSKMQKNGRGVNEPTPITLHTIITTCGRVTVRIARPNILNKDDIAMAQ